jgi:hypothetical protein
MTACREGLLAAALAAGLAYHPLGMAAAPEPTKRPPLKGNWGGEGAGVEVTEEGARLFFDCAKGSIDVPITPDEDGRFEVTGRYVKEGPGPTRPEQTQGVGARYLGQLEGNTLTLSIRLTLARDVLGPFTLTRNRMPRVRECG